MGLWENSPRSSWIHRSHWICCTICTLGWDFDPWDSILSWSCNGSWAHDHILVVDCFAADWGNWYSQRVCMLSFFLNKKKRKKLSLSFSALVYFLLNDVNFRISFTPFILSGGIHCKSRGVQRSFTVAYLSFVDFVPFPFQHYCHLLVILLIVFCFGSKLPLISIQNCSNLSFLYDQILKFLGIW